MMGGWVGVIYYTKLAVLESNLLVDWVIYYYKRRGVIYYMKLAVLESNLLVVDWVIYYYNVISNV